jgi:hypothetical protein
MGIVERGPRFLEKNQDCAQASTLQATIARYARPLDVPLAYSPRIGSLSPDSKINFIQLETRNLHLFPRF